MVILLLNQKKNKNVMKYFWLAILCLITVSISAQVNYNQRDDKYTLLGLKRAKESYESKKKEMQRYEALFNKNYISQAEYETMKASFADAEVNYQQSLLAVIFEQQFISIESAVKYQLKDGKKRVRLKLANTSGGSEEYQKIVNIDDALFRSLQPDIIHNVYVSLTNETGSVISQPYEAKINELTYGKPQTIDFSLLQDLDAVIVNLIYGNGTTRTMKIFLQKDASQNIVAVQSRQFSQELELGNSASFDLQLELYSGINNNYYLEVVNLPAQINRYFKDPASQARLSQFKFTENVNTQNAALQVSMPDRPSDEIVMDKPILFYVLVIPSNRLSELKELHSKDFSEEEINNMNIGYVKLEVTPRGKGILLVKAPQLFYTINAGEKVKMNIDIANEGTQRIDNIELKTDLPLNWTKNIEPHIINRLHVSEDKRVNMEFSPPVDIPAGRYEIRIKTTGLSDNQPITAEDKIVTIEVAAKPNLFGTAVIILLILGVISGIVVFGVKLSRK